ncbi:hypothetical protein IFR05_013031 [Cadophora sp. M221]|nr:hypothetical protein IFR05_013031 [Cadophora sp. M221]
MTWASIAAAPRPVAKISAVKIEPKPKTAISAIPANDIEQAVLQIEDLSVKYTNPIERSIKEKEVATTRASEADNDWGSSSQNADEEDLNPTGCKYIQFCIDNKDAILDLHSSVAFTQVFKKQCHSCERYFKHCMFSNRERKATSGYSYCRWCTFDRSCGDYNDQFSIHWHLHCNRGGKNECGTSWGLNLVRPKQKVKDIMEGNGLADVNAPEVRVKIVPKKMSQKEKRRLCQNATERAGF